MTPEQVQFTGSPLPTNPPFPFTARAVLFDMDGGLTVNGHFHAEAWQRFAREHLGLDIAADDARIHGGRNADILAALTGHAPAPETLRACEAAKEGSYRDLARGKLRPVKGLHSYLDWLSARGIACALVTSAERVNVAFVLGQLALGERFPVRVSAEDVRRGKPDPEPYEKAASLLGVPPAECLVHEDAPSGVRSALAAGCAVVALTTTLGAEILGDAGARLNVPDFEAWMVELRSGAAT